MSLFLLLCGSCFTGVEMTDKIKLSRAEKQETHRDNEADRVLDTIHLATLNQWMEGKRFFVASDRADVLFRNSNVNPSRQIISYKNHYTKTRPNGEPEIIIIFNDNSNNQLEFPAGTADINTITAKTIPMLIDMDLVDTADSLLTHKQLWTMKSNWDTMDGNPRQGTKFVAVKVTGVSYGESPTLPYRIFFETSDGVTGSFLAAPSSENPTRSFSSQFSNEDPRKKFNNIPDAIWDNIRHSVVTPGMTKEQCRLALGNPSEVTSGRDWSNYYDVWIYPGGKRLRFQNSILESLQ